MTYNFKDQLSVGHEWEVACEAELKKAGYLTAHLSVNQQKAVGADYRVRRPEWTEPRLVECKRVVKFPDKIFLEITSGSRPGCVMTSTADLWLWRVGGGDDLTAGCCLVAIPPAVMRMEIAMHSPTWRTNYTVVSNREGGASGYWVPLSSGRFPEFTTYSVESFIKLVDKLLLDTFPKTDNRK